ncbi:6458_t:CDS:2 [Ambispora gerdemannii]|uniref:6458_t:CDS:1 n=1 Tax=Ambispora gerdemannii TaxID=144530 RepID=A0A9N9C7Y8_9GLOM|nr:6458_t:CDS:2 [Ambispora gerdemannii]
MSNSPTYNGNHSSRRFSGKGEQSIFLGAASSGKLHLLDKNHDNRIIWLLFAAPVMALLFMILPAIVELHGVGADIYRFIEPLIGIPLNFFILVSAEVFVDYSEHERKFLFTITEKGFCSFLFTIGAALYAQGAGMHSTAIIAKDKIQDLITENPNITSQFPAINSTLEYMETDLEHVAGYYIYATGAAIITWAHLLAYRRQRHDEISNVISFIAFFLGSFFYAVLLTSVAIEFPKGTLVGLIYVLALGVPLLAFMLKSGQLFSKGRRLVPQYYTLSYGLALIMIVIWVAVNGGFVDRRQAGWFDH